MSGSEWEDMHCYDFELTLFSFTCREILKTYAAQDVLEFGIDLI